MATTTTIGEREYRELALNDPDHNWELWDGVPVEKPAMSMKHNDVAFSLGLALANQLDRRVYRVNVNGDRVRLSPRAYYIPDVVVIPVADQQLIDPRALGAYADPLPLVVAIWSPTSGDYDIEAKIPAYRARGDLEIWLIHPYERTRTAWRKQPDGSYSQHHYDSDTIPVVSLPGVSIDFDTPSPS